MLKPFVVMLVLGSCVSVAIAQREGGSGAGSGGGGGGGRDRALPTTPYSQMLARKDVAAPEKQMIDEAVARGVEIIVGMQEGESKGEWPYEGVYRERGKIPIGYRVGGTGISGMSLLRAPGYDGDEARKAAVRRAAEFVIAGADDPAMVPDHNSTYDVRGWGYTYAAWFLLTMQEAKAVPADMKEGVDATIKRYIDAIHKTAIPESGGWNYSTPAGAKKPNPSSPFMTSPTLMTLFEAKQQGYEVDAAAVDRGLATLERGRSATGSVSYAGTADRRPEATPGSVGRMLATECALSLAGRSSEDRLRGAVDAFIVHWEWLDKRRAQTGTHIAPYGVAPYYFYYAHYYAGQAIELLPQRERGEYRRRLGQLLFSVRLDDGSWNDRVFPRSANYGTAMSMMALLMPSGEKPAGWEGVKEAVGK
jgi:hypothetical protein